MPTETSSGRAQPAPSLRRRTTVERFEQLDVGHGEVERGPVARVCDRLGFLRERRCDAVVSGDVDHAFMLPRNPGGRWVMSRSSEQHDRSGQGRGPNSPLVALIQLIKSHYRTLADSKHPIHRTLFGTPQTVMGHPAVHSTARMSLDAPALYGHNRNIMAAWLTLLIAAETHCPLVQTGPLSSTPRTRARPPGTSDTRNERF